MVQVTRGLRNLRGLAAALAVALMSAAAAMTAPVSAAETPGDSKSIEVELNEGRLVRLRSAANNVFIANPEIANITVKSTRLIYVFGVRTGETTLYAVDRNDRMVANLSVRVVHNLSGLNDNLKKMVSSGDVRAFSVDGGIVLSGAVSDSQDAENARRLAQRYVGGEKEDVINRIKVISPNQVNLRVRIAEVQRNIIKQFGFNWDLGYRRGDDFTFGVASGDNPIVPNNLEIDGLVDLPGNETLSPEAVPFSSAAGLAFAEDLDATFITRGTPGIENYFAGSSFGGFDINTLVDTLVTDGLVTVLAEPNLTAMTGETASFLAGGEFPIPFIEDDGIVITFKEFGVSLAFTPITLNANRISMRVRPEVSQLSTQGQVVISGFTVPGLTTRRAETTVELASGQSFAIAGLFLDNSLQDLRQLPGLSNIPILGQLFDSDRFERRETELMIIVTPYLVTPTDGQIPLPTDGYVAASNRVTPARNLARAPYSPHSIPLRTEGAVAQRTGPSGGFLLD